MPEGTDNYKIIAEECCWTCKHFEVEYYDLNFGCLLAGKFLDDAVPNGLCDKYESNIAG